MRGMTEKPILFSGPMVRAILDGNKTQTRRIVKPQPPIDEIGRPEHGKILGPSMFEPVAYDRHGEMIPGPEIYGAFDDSGAWGVKYPSGQPGERLWVRETCWIWGRWFKNGKTLTGKQRWRFKADTPHGVHFKANHVQNAVKSTPRERRAYWKRPSIFMPRWACRLLLDVKSVRVERLNDISVEDAIKEGITYSTLDCPRMKFAQLWDSINKERGDWQSNPWVWVVEFERVTYPAVQKKHCK